MGSYNKENINYVKFGFGIMKVTGDALRQLFRSRHPNLTNFLIANKQRCQSLLRKCILTKAQWDLLYPQTGTPILEDFDVTLLLHLLTNVSNITSPVQGWGQFPLASDTSLGADLVRLRKLRNAHAHNKLMEMQNSEFGKKWTDLTQILINVGGPHFKTVLDKYLSDPLDINIKIETVELPRLIKDREKRYLADAKDSERIFVRTRAFKHALKRLKETNVITITGSFGCGKKFLACNIALALSKTSYEVIPVANSQEIRECHRRDKKQLFVINDPLGGTSLDSQLFTDWKEQYEKVQSMFDTSLYMKIIFTIRLAIFRNKKCKRHFRLMYHDEINISEGRYCWSKAEKDALLQKYNLQHLFYSTEDIDNQCLPLLCKKASESYTISENEHMIIMTPIDLFITELQELLECLPSHYFVLLLVMVYQNKFKLSNGNDYQVINQLSTRFRIPLQHFFYDHLNSILREVEGSFLVERDGVYSFVCDILHDIITFNAGRIAPEFIIDHCSSRYLRKNIIFESSFKRFSPLSIALKDEMFDAWFKRMVSEIRSGVFLDLLCSETFLSNSSLIINKIDILPLSDLKEVVLSESVDDIEGCNVFSSNIRHVLKDFSVGYRLTPVHVFLMLGRSDIFLSVWKRVKTFFPRNKTYISDLLKAALIGGSTKSLEKILKLYSRGTERLRYLFRGGEKLLSKCIPLCISCACDNLPMTKYLIQSGYSINTPNRDGDTPLALAVWFHNTRMTEFLLNENVEINSKNNRGLTPLMMAVENDAIVERLLNTNVDMHMTTNEGETVLMIACALGKQFVVRILLQRITDNHESDESVNMFVNKMNKNGATALLMACECKKDTSFGIAAALLQHGANPNVMEDKLGLTPIHFAVASGSPSLVDLLIRYKAKVNCLDKNGVSPLFLAAEMGFPNILKILINHGACIDFKRHSDNASALLISAEFGHEEIVSLILRIDSSLINEPNFEGSTPLLLATLNNHSKICEILTEYKADIDISNKNGYSPIIVAARNGNVKLLELYLQNGSDIRCKTNEGYSSLHLACMMGNLKAVKSLMEHGANQQAKDNNGKTPLYYALQMKHNKICTALNNPIPESKTSESSRSNSSSFSFDSISTPGFDADSAGSEVTDSDFTLYHVLYRREWDTNYGKHHKSSTSDSSFSKYPYKKSIAGSSIRSGDFSRKSTLISHDSFKGLISSRRKLYK